MIQITINEKSGELRTNSEALNALTDDECTYLRELAADLKRRCQDAENESRKSKYEFAGFPKDW